MIQLTKEQRDEADRILEEIEMQTIGHGRDKEDDMEQVADASEDDQEKLLVHDKQTKSSTARIATIISFYIATSISMVLINRALLRNNGYPITFLWIQLVVAAALLKLSNSIAGTPVIKKGSWDDFKHVYPLILLNVLGLILNTLCLTQVDAIIYQIARSLVLPFTVMLTPLLLGERVTMSVLIACSIICAGFLMASLGECMVEGAGGNMSLSPFGIMLGVASSLTTAVQSFIIKMMLGRPDSAMGGYLNGAFTLVYANNLYSSLLLLPIVLVETIPATRGLSDFPFKNILVGGLVSGIMGLLINLASFLQIHVTSPMSHTVSSAARGVLQFMAASLLLNEEVTNIRVSSTIIISIGTILYTAFKK